MGTEHRVSKMKRIKSSLIFSIKKIKNQKKWTKEEDELLIALAEKYSEKNWKEISKRFLKKNSLQCFSRYKRIRPGIIKGSWKKEEDIRIIELVNKFGKAWSKISKTLGTRNGKQIRDRYINVLDPDIKKGKFTEDEDNILIQLYRQHGPKWATIAKYYPNRTADMIKNRFHSSIKKKLSPEVEEKNSKEEAILCNTPNKCDASSSNIETHSQSSKHSLLNPSGKPESLKEIYYEHSVINDIRQQVSQPTLLCRDNEQEFYISNSNLFNYEFVHYDKNLKNEDQEYSSNDEFNWNFEDYFSI